MCHETQFKSVWGLLADSSGRVEGRVALEARVEVDGVEVVFLEGVVWFAVGVLLVGVEVALHLGADVPGEFAAGGVVDALNGVEGVRHELRVGDLEGSLRVAFDEGDLGGGVGLETAEDGLAVGPEAVGLVVVLDGVGDFVEAAEGGRDGFRVARPGSIFSSPRVVSSPDGFSLGDLSRVASQCLLLTSETLFFRVGRRSQCSSLARAPLDRTSRTTERVGRRPYRR